MRRPQTSPRPETLAGEGLAVSPSHAICVYAEPLVHGRRVVVVGDAGDGVGERLLLLGARTVHVYDPEPRDGALEAQARGIVVQELPAGELDVRDGAFDLALVPDLGAVDPDGTLLARLRRVLGPRGAALVGGGAGPGAETVDYYELYDRVALQFSSVRMVAEVAFSGVALADLGLGGATPEVTVDTQLAGPPPAPARFFALASQDAVRLADYTIVELPSELTDLPEVRADSGHATLAQAQLRASLLEAQIDELRARVSRAAAAEEQAGLVPELEARVHEADASRRAAAAAAVDQADRADRATHEARRLAEELVRERDRGVALEAALGETERALLAVQGRALEVEARAAGIEGERTRAVAALDAAFAEAAADRVARAAAEGRAAAVLTGANVIADEQSSELGRLEEALRERARVVRELEREVARRERLVHDLLGHMGQPGEPAAAGAAPGPSDDGLRARLDAASMEIARREGEREELLWRVSELEQQVTRLEAEQTEVTETLPPPRMKALAEGVPPLGALEDELDALRQALAQEHTARVAAESGEELGKAREELKRQALLLEQLSRELEARDRARTGADGDPLLSVDRSEA